MNVKDLEIFKTLKADVEEFGKAAWATIDEEDTYAIVRLDPTLTYNFIDNDGLVTFE